jgi:hypothetical protein
MKNVMPDLSRVVADHAALCQARVTLCWLSDLGHAPLVIRSRVAGLPRRSQDPM